jgi:vitamin B12 transporter
MAFTPLFPHAAKLPFLFQIIFALFCGLLAWPLHRAEAQTAAPKSLPALIVSASRIAQPSAHIGSSVSLLTRQDLLQSGAESLDQALSLLPGISKSQRGGFGTQSSLRIRGQEGYHTLVLIDGVKVNDPSGPQSLFDFGGLPIDAIERVEVLRGPQSTLYGADAIGGVINIITRPPTTGLNGALGAELGRYNSRAVRGYIGGGGRKASANFGYLLRHTDGFSAADEKAGNSERDGARLSEFTSRALLSITDHLGLEFAARHHAQNVAFDNAFPLADSSDTQKDRHSSARLALVARYKGIEQNLALSSSLHRRLNQGAFGPFTFRGARLGADYQANLFFSSDNSLVVGANFEVEKSRNDFERRHRAQKGGIYADYQSQWGENFFTTTGLRYDYHNLFGAIPTFRLSASYLLPIDGGRVHGALANGFRAPSLFELFSSFGDPHLDAETSLGAEIGYEQDFTPLLEAKGLAALQLRSDVTLFTTSLRNKLDFSPRQNRFANISRAKSQGVETSLTIKYGPQTHINLGYSYIATENERDKDLLLRPRHSGTVQFGQDFGGGVSSTATLRVVGRRFDFGGIRLPGFASLDAVLRYDVTPTSQFSARLINAANRDYQEVAGYGTSGRALYFSFDQHF